jgi:hypothetical protein
MSWVISTGLPCDTIRLLCPLAGARDKNKMLGRDVMSFLGTRIAGLGLTQCANTAPGMFVRT